MKNKNGPKTIWEGLLCAVPFLMLFSGGISLYDGLHRFKMLPDTGMKAVFTDSLNYSLLFLLGFLSVAAFIFKNNFSLWKDLAIISPLIFIFGGFGHFIYVNGACDTSPKKFHKVRIIKIYTKRRSGYLSKHMKIESWHHPGKTLSLSVGSGADCDAAANPTRLEVITHAGRMGYEWIKSYKCL